MKEDYNQDIESLRKKIKQILEIKYPSNQIKIYLKVTPAEWNKWKTEFQGSKTKQIVKKKKNT
jgi:hypothetical protein